MAKSKKNSKRRQKGNGAVIGSNVQTEEATTQRRKSSNQLEINRPISSTTASTSRIDEIDDAEEVVVSPVRVLVLGALLLGIGTVGFYSIPGMIADGAQGSKLVNAFYCASVTLMTIGYGDICPGDLSVYGKVFLVTFVLCGMGMFCGPVMDITSSWRTQVPHGGVIVLSSVVLGAGVAIFTSIEGVSNTDALYASIITGTTIGYGDLTPKSNSGKVAVALYGVVGINVLAVLLKPARDFFERLCHVKQRKLKLQTIEATTIATKKYD